MQITERMRSLLRRDEGLSTVEYVVLVVLIVGMSVGLWNKFGHTVNSRLQGTHDVFKKEVSRK